MYRFKHCSDSLREILRDHGSIEAFDAKMRFDDLISLFGEIEKLKKEAELIGFLEPHLGLFTHLISELKKSYLTKLIKKNYHDANVKI